MTVVNFTLFERCLQNIRNEIDVLANLNEINQALLPLSIGERTQISTNLQLNAIFDCLNASNKDQILTTAEILKSLLPSLSSSVLINHYEAPLIRALLHPEKEVKQAVLIELIRVIPSNELHRLINNDTTLLTNVIKCLCDEEISVAEYAIKFLTQLGQNPAGLAAICHPVTKQVLVQSTESSDLYKLRMYQVVIDISVKSNDALQKIEKEGLVEGLLSHLASEDVLSKLALLEEITKLALTPHGLDFLKKKRLLDVLAEELVTSQDNPLASILTPGYLKLFGNVGQKFGREVLVSYPGVLKGVFDAVDSNDLAISITALETVGIIGSSPVGKMILGEQDSKYIKHIMRKLEGAMKNLPMEWRVRAIYAFADLVHLEIDSRQDRKVEQLTEEWVSYLTEGSLNEIMLYVQQPFPEMKVAAMQLLTEMSNLTWGQNKIKNTPGFLEFLLDRRTETTLEGMQSKYNVIKNLTESPRADDIFGEADLSRLLEFVKQGPCYAPVLMEVAIEGQPS